MSVLPHNAFYNASRHRNRLSNNNSLKLQRIGLNIDSRNIVSDTPPIIHPSRSTISLHSLKNPPIHFNSSPPKDVLLRNNKTIRNYQLSDSDVRFCCSGHGITSKDNPTTFIISIILVLGLPAVFFGRIAVDLWYTLSPAVPIIAAYLTLLVWSSMLKTAFAEPGILPTQLDSDAQDSVHRDITLRDGLVTVKYCDICHIFRPPRASHCRLCNSCVDGIDHHCSFLNICIGRRNYPSFLTFCTITTLTLAYFAAFSAVHIYQLTLNTRVSHSQSFGDALQQDPASAVVFIVSVVFFIPISLLLAYHIRLVLINSTTIEQLRSKALTKAQKADSENSPQNPFTTDLKHSSTNSQFNPFSQGVLANILWMAFRPGSNYSYVRFPELAYGDARKSASV